MTMGKEIQIETHHASRNWPNLPVKQGSNGGNPGLVESKNKKMSTIKVILTYKI